MKILYCNKYNFRFSGTENYLFETMDLMRASGHEVALFSMSDPRGAPTPYDRHFIAPIEFKGGGFFKKAQSAAHAIYSSDARNKIRALIQAFRPDVAHVRNIYHHLSPSILWELKASGVPVVYHMNDMKLLCPTYNMVSPSGTACEQCKRGHFWHAMAAGCHASGRVAATVLAMEAYFHRWLRTYEKCVDLVLAPSEFVKQKLLESGWKGATIQVLPHFQNLSAETRPHPEPDAPILYFGRLSPEKGVSDLITAVSKISDLRLIVAGDGPRRYELEKLAADLGLKNVSFVGHLTGTALTDLIAGSQFTVFPSRAYETFGKSILESYAQNRAVIASDLGSRRELVLDGKTGLLYPAADVNELAARIQFLREHPERSCTMGETGYQLVRERYGQAQHVAALVHIYQELSQTKNSRPTVGVDVEVRPARRWMSETSQLALSTHPINPQHKTKSLKIAYIGGRGVIGKYSGIETYYEETGKRLAAMGHEVTLYCRKHFTPETLIHNGTHIVRVPTIRTKHMETLVHTGLSTVHACFSGYDVVHYHTLGPSLFSFLPRMFGKRTVVTVQGLDWQRRKWSWLARSVLKAGEWASATLPNTTVVVSHTLQNRFRSRHRVESVYIPNGTQLLERKSGPHLERLGLSADQYVLFLGRFSPEKNCDLLIDAFEKIDSDMTLVLAGGSSHTDAYAAALRKRQSARLKILDWLSGDALQEVLSNAALFVLPSDLEGLSLSLLEAMGAGLCVLASDTPENLEVVEDCGFTFKAGDVQDLQRMLTLLLSDPELRNGAGKKARARVQRDYLWDGVAAQIESTYHNTLSRAAPSAP